MTEAEAPTTKMTFSTNRFPLNSTYQAGLLFGGVVQPFALSATNRPIRLVSGEDNIGQRCYQCGGYWWPSCSWRGKDSWICALCGEESAMEARPKAEEMRDCTVLYEESTSGPVVFMFLVDGTGEEAFMDACLLAIVGVVQQMVFPGNVRFGFALCLNDSLSVVEFSPHRFFVSTCRLNGREFRLGLEECTTPIKATTGDRELFLHALSSCKAIIRSQGGKLPFATATTMANVLGRSMVSLLRFLDPVAGAHVFAFAEHATLTLPCRESVSQFRTSNTNGLDFITAGNAEQDVDSELRLLVRESGGMLACHPFETMGTALPMALLARFQLGFVLRGVVRARTCPELTVAMPRRTSPAQQQQPFSAQGVGDQGEWWITTVIKRVLQSVIATPPLLLLQKLPAPAVATTAASALASSATLPASFFLGPGHCNKEGAGLWTVPSCSPTQTLGFELDFADQLMGMESFTYPRAMAVQVASSFVTLDGKRFTRVESKCCEGTDTPACSQQETWKWADYSVLVYLLVRLLVFSFDKQDYADVVLDWAARAIAQRGLQAEKFERKLGRQLFGWLQAPECGQSLRGNFCLAASLTPADLERYIWPALCRADLPNNLLPLSRNSLASPPHSYILDAVSHIFVALGQDVDEARRARDRAEQMASASDAVFIELLLSEVMAIGTNGSSGGSGMTLNPFAKTPSEANRDLFASLLYEDGPELAAFVSTCVERSKVVAL
ncbi:hypothetical protein BASA81_008583 [Batrachochytrium salamandrivorans]|nr:hypothetical protein BASA81_008583 [Batrachochytrium salamandrivorans]